MKSVNHPPLKVVGNERYYNTIKLALVNWIR